MPVYAAVMVEPAAKLMVPVEVKIGAAGAIDGRLNVSDEPVVKVAVLVRSGACAATDTFE